jgi:RNA 3'-terminal phosphate cyclase (ATP)
MSYAQAGPVLVDGTTLEGGGQLLRLSLSLSSLTKTPFHIFDIRGKRGPQSNPGKDGGMKQAHLAGARWLEAVTDAQTQGMELKSRDLVFKPSTSTIKAQRSIDVWKEIYQGGKLVGRDARITMTSPGSVFLVLQAVLPYVLFSTPPCDSAEARDATVRARLTIVGGTNVWHSLSYEYADQVLFPILHTKVGLPLVKMKLVHRAWSIGNNGVGEVQFLFNPLPRGTQLPAFQFTNRGELTKIKVSILAPNVAFRAGIRDAVTRRLLLHFPDTDIEYPVDESSGGEKRLYLLLVAETDNGYKLGRDWLYDQRLNTQDPQKTINKMADKVVNDLRIELEHGGCVDGFLQDQLVVFQALCKGRAVVHGGEPSLHTQTARWLAGHLVGVHFDSEGNCEGLGLEASEQHAIS